MIRRGTRCCYSILVGSEFYFFHFMMKHLLLCCGSGSGIRCLFDPLDPGLGPGMGKKSRSGSGSGAGMNIPDHISESLVTNFWVKNI
jgi:hypothetical protein